MEIHDALDIALHGLARGVAECGPESRDQGQHGQPSERARGHQPSSTNSNVSTPTTR